jgi:hypothetical protein
MTYHCISFERLLVIALRKLVINSLVGFLTSCPAPLNEKRDAKQAQALFDGDEVS